MSNNYIDIPLYTTIHDISSRNYTLSATQYKSFCIKNTNVCKLSDFLDRELIRTDLGNEIGSSNYVEMSPYIFIKTKALQPESFLLDESKDAIEYITPQSFNNAQMKLKAGDILISKDSNVGEIVILDKDYPNAALCGGIYRLPISKHKYYLLAFIKSDLFRQQIDYLVPRGSTIRHGKTTFLNCLIPIPNYDKENTIKYVECLTKAIINKQISIRERYRNAMAAIQSELETNQSERIFNFSLPTIKEIQDIDRIDASLYSEDFKRNEFLISNYLYGVSNIKSLGFVPSRGQNLQVSNIGISIHSSEYRNGYYKLILPKYISKYGTVDKCEYLGNPNKLKTLKKGEIIFGAEGNEKGRSLVVVEEQDCAITNIHGITLNQTEHNLQKGIFVKLFLDYYRSNGMVDAYAVGGNGGSLAIKYWEFIKFPNFPDKMEKEIASLYFNSCQYNCSRCTLETFDEYDNQFNKSAGIYELDKAMKYLQSKLDKAINDVANDIIVDISF